MQMHFILVQIFPLWSRGNPSFLSPILMTLKKPIYIHLVFTKLIGRVIKSRAHLFRMEKFFLLPLKNSITWGAGVFKIFYRGEADEKERYYKIIISETPLDIRNDEGQKKQPLFYPTVSLETYFVVRPKDPDFKYDLNINQGILKNTGNTYFRVLLHQNCDGDDDSEPYVFYLLPNQQIKDLRLSQKSRKYIVIFDKYYSIGNCE